MANRQSAQRSRVRKLQYISELERSVTSLQVNFLIYKVLYKAYNWMCSSNQCGFFFFFLITHLLTWPMKAEVSVLSPRVAFLDHQRLLLNVDNSALKQRIAALAQDKIFKDGTTCFTCYLLLNYIVYLHKFSCLRS